MKALAGPYVQYTGEKDCLARLENLCRQQCLHELRRGAVEHRDRFSVIPEREEIENSAMPIET
jgi:hypothetical protein